MKLLKRLWYRLVPTYRRLELRCVTYAHGDTLIRGSAEKPESKRWKLATFEEDRNRRIGFVFIERRERVWS